MTAILGISAFYHDSSAALLVDGIIVAAVQEERFTRRKNDARFPKHAIAYCLQVAGLSLSDIEHIIFYEKPFLKFERLLDTYVSFAPQGLRSFIRAMPVWIKEKLFQKRVIVDALRELDKDWADRGQIKFCEHHMSHCASAFFPAPFDNAVVLSIDGVGERTTAAVAVGEGSALTITREIHFPHSLGLLYSAFTEYLGFRVNFDEYKVMGLAPYGTAKYTDLILGTLVDVKADGSFWVDQRYFSYATGLKSINRRFCSLFGQPRRAPDSPITQFHMDIAKSIQAVTEDIMLKIATDLRHEYDLPHLCLAGGVAQNSVVNGLLARSGIFDAIWIQPAPGDSGGALGAALAYWHLALNQPRIETAAPDGMQGACLGPEFTHKEIERTLASLGSSFGIISDDSLFDQIAGDLASGKVVGWFDGRMEFGPRALGNRSILGDPRSSSMQRTINLKVKRRESFRPFAPAIMQEYLSEWFDLNHDSPYMGMVAPVANAKLEPLTSEEDSRIGFDKLHVRRSCVPAVTHVDGSARIQTVDADTRPRLYALIKAFYAKTGCPMLLNTSFNGQDEPIVCTPQEAHARFIDSDIDILVCGNCVIRKLN